METEWTGSSAGGLVPSLHAPLQGPAMSLEVGVELSQRCGPCPRGSGGTLPSQRMADPRSSKGPFPQNRLSTRQRVQSYRDMPSDTHGPPSRHSLVDRGGPATPLAEERGLADWTRTCPRQDKCPVSRLFRFHCPLTAFPSHAVSRALKCCCM